MRTIRLCAAALAILAGVPVSLYAQGSDDSAAKIQAYKLATQTISTLNDQMGLVQKSIDQVGAKVKSLQEQVDDGVASSKPLLEMYRKQLDALEDSKDQADGKLKELKGIVEQLKKDPDVGAEVTADEGLREMSTKLQEASGILQNTAP